MTRKESLVTALLLSFGLLCLDLHFIGRKAVAEKIRLDEFEEEFYPTVRDVEEMREGYEDFQLEASQWSKRSITASPKRRGKF